MVLKLLDLIQFTSENQEIYFVENYKNLNIKNPDVFSVPLPPLTSLEDLVLYFSLLSSPVNIIKKLGQSKKNFSRTYICVFGHNYWSSEHGQMRFGVFYAGKCFLCWQLTLNFLGPG